MPEINLLYVHTKTMGYGRMGSYLAEEIANQGVTVYDDLPLPPDIKCPGSPVTEDRLSPRNRGIANLVLWMSVPTHATGWWDGQIPCIFTMWEATRLPEAFVDTLHMFDTVVVPSHHNVELFSQFHDNVKFVPLGVDPAIWHYEKRPEVKGFFRFMVGGSGARKGADLAVDAFCKLWGKDGSWGDGPVPLLIHKNPKGESYYGAGGRIQQYQGKFTAEEERLLYQQTHCYLQPSRGEGFGLQPLQALAMGIPTILTDAHGHESFAHHGIGISATPKQSGYFIFGDAGDWWEPDFDELVEAMRDVYENYAEHEARAKDEAAKIAETFTWTHSANKLLDVLGRDRLLPYQGDGGFTFGAKRWIYPEAKRYKIITNKDHFCEIAGTSFFFKEGEEYWELADIKRILFESGKLDPRCLDEDDPDRSGLTEEQLARAGKYRASHSDCPTCHKPVNR